MKTQPQKNIQVRMQIARLLEMAQTENKMPAQKKCIKAETVMFHMKYEACCGSFFMFILYLHLHEDTYMKCK